MEFGMKKTFLVASLICASGCAVEYADEPEDPIDDSFIVPDGKDDAFGVTEDSYLAIGVLEVVNRLTFEELDHQVPLNARAARNIVDTRSSGPIRTLAELDAIPYVGQSAFNALAAYAQAEGFVGSCGDGDVQSIETCDDGNTINGDGCSSLCESEGPTGPGGPYEDRPIVHGIMDGSYEGVAILEVANTRSLEVLDNDVGLDVHTAKNIYYERGSGFQTLEALAAISGVDSSTFQKLLDYAVANDLVPSCGDGSRQHVMEMCDDGNLDPNDGCDAACRLESVCGDGVIEFYETCEDGNTDDGDGCSAVCELEIKHEDEGNYTIGTYRLLAGRVHRGDDDCWRLSIDRPSIVSIDISGGSRGRNSCRFVWFTEYPNTEFSNRQTTAFDAATSSRLRSNGRTYDIRSNCGRDRSEQDGRWDATFELIPGTHEICIRGHGVGSGGNHSANVDYQIELHIEPNGPICGNGVVEEGEFCDDGNTRSSDGCSVACNIEHLAERESNNSISSNNAIANYRFVQGTITTGDADVFGFRLDARETVFISTKNSLADCPFDGYLELYDQNGVLIAEDDDSAGDYCPLLNETLEAGRYFVKLRHTRNDRAGGSYLLEISR